MDIPRPEEDDTLIALDPLEVVEHVLSAENLSFDRTDDGDLAFCLTGDWKDYELWFAWRPEADCLQLCLSIDLKASKARRRPGTGQPDQPAGMAGPFRGLGRRRRGGVPPRHGAAGRRPPEHGADRLDDRRRHGIGRPLLPGLRLPDRRRKITRRGHDRLHVRD